MVNTAPRPPGLHGDTDTQLASAEEVLEALRPGHGLWEGAPEDWLYRGQADSVWELQPTGVRDPDAYTKVGIALSDTARSQSAYWQRAQQQKDMLEVFRDRLNASGIAMPLEAPALTSWDQGSVHVDGLPLKSGYPLLALAQHVGLPTTMLDWTRRGWVALYFAVADAASRVAAERVDPTKSAPSFFAIWALKKRAFDGRDTNIFEALLYQPPSSSNANLHAQSGLVSMSLDEDTPSLERQFAGRDFIKRVVAPTSVAPKLLRLLHLEDVDGASMFPGPYGVVNAMKEAQLWDVRPVALSQ